MRHQRHTLLVAALALAVIAVVPGGAVAANGVSVSGDQAADGTVTVTVTENNTTVANATVTVEALNNSSYAGEGDHTTGENGTVELPAPEENVSVQVTASVNNTTAETTLDLVAPTDDDSDLSVGVTQAGDGTGIVSVTNASGAGVANASVNVSTQDNVTYEGLGDYTTDENGTVELPAPEENVTIDVLAEADNRTANTTVTLTAPTDDNASDGNASFGERVSAFVHQLQANGNMSGQQVAAFVVSNNPGADNRPDHVDPGPPADDDEDDERGNGNGADGNSGNGAGANGNGNGDSGNGNSGNGNGHGNNGDGTDTDGNGNNGHSNGNGNGASGGPA